jgi:acetyl esterase/lipase
MKTLVGVLRSATTAPAPDIRCWIPERGQNGTGLVIFPGGGYGGLADHEGSGYAEFFSKHGVSCFVVRYRLGPEGFRHPAMLEDALAAISTVRGAATALGVDPGRIGVMGSSAGGHLTAHSLVAWDTYPSDISLRPDFGILCYPVITSGGEFCHQGSMANLLGPTPAPALLEEVSCEKRVTTDTPPCFIWHTAEDSGVPVENSMMFASALRRNGIPFELHIYAKGDHGLGLNAPFPWGEECLRWMGVKTGAGRNEIAPCARCE